MGSSPDEVDFFFFNLHNPSSCTMALGSTRPLTEMSTGIFLGVKGQLVLKADILTAICEAVGWRKCGSLNVSQPCGPSWPVTGIALALAWRWCMTQHGNMMCREPDTNGISEVSYTVRSSWASFDENCYVLVFLDSVLSSRYQQKKGVGGMLQGTHDQE
jgi:hypothetical protein